MDLFERSKMRCVYFHWIPNAIGDSDRINKRIELKYCRYKK